MAITKAARESYGPFPTHPPYFTECFLSIQDSIEKAFIEASSSKPPPPIKLQRFAYPSISEDTFIQLAGMLFPLLFVICMMFSITNTIKVSDELRNDNISCLPSDTF